LAMSAICMFGQLSNAKSFIVQYDPHRQTVVQCSKAWLLTCAFYELPCSGSYFHLPCDTTLDVTHNNDSMDKLDDKEYTYSDEERNDTQLYEDNNDTHLYEEIVKHIKKKRKLADTEKSPTLLSSLEPSNDIVEDRFEKFVDQHFLEHEFPVQQQQDSMSAKNHVQLYAYLSKNKNKLKYQELWQKKETNPVHNHIAGHQPFLKW